MSNTSQFRKQAHKFIIRIIEKIRERNSLHYAVTRNADCFDPKKLKSENATILRAKAKNICTIAVTAKLLPFNETDRALIQYTELLSERANLPNFDRGTHSLDEYLFDMVHINKHK